MAKGATVLSGGSGGQGVVAKTVPGQAGTGGTGSGGGTPIDPSIKFYVDNSLDRMKAEMNTEFTVIRGEIAQVETKVTNEIDKRSTAIETGIREFEQRLNVKFARVPSTGMFITTILVVVGLVVGTIIAVWAYGSGQFGAGATASSAASSLAAEANLKSDANASGISALQETAAAQQETLKQILTKLDSLPIPEQPK